MLKQVVLMNPIYEKKVSEKRLWTLEVFKEFTLTAGEDLNFHGLESSGKEIKFELEDQPHSKAIRCLSLSPSGRYLASVSFDSQIKVWKVDGTKIVLISLLEGHLNEVKCASWSADERYLATCSRDKSIWIWEFDEEEDFRCESVLQDHDQDIKFLNWHNQENFLISASFDNTVCIYEADFEDFALRKKLDHYSTVWCAKFKPESFIIATCTEDATLRIWSPYENRNSQNFFNSYRCISILKMENTLPLYTLDWHFRGDFLAIAGQSNKIIVYKTRENNLNFSLELLRTFNLAHSQDINCIKWNRSESSNKLFSCGDDGYLKCWEVEF